MVSGRAVMADKITFQIVSDGKVEALVVLEMDRAHIEILVAVFCQVVGNTLIISGFAGEQLTEGSSAKQADQ